LNSPVIILFLPYTYIILASYIPLTVLPITGDETSSTTMNAILLLLLLAALAAANGGSSTQCEPYQTKCCMSLIPATLTPYLSNLD
jgi:hypothetical protein